MTCGGGCWCWSVLLVVCVLVLISVSREPDSLVMDNKTVAMRAIPSLSRVTIMITSHGIMAWSPAYVHHPLCLQPARSAAPVAIHATLCRLTGPDHATPQPAHRCHGLYSHSGSFSLRLVLIRMNSLCLVCNLLIPPLIDALS
jgi:hypothetical protein